MHKKRLGLKASIRRFGRFIQPLEWCDPERIRCPNSIHYWRPQSLQYMICRLCNVNRKHRKKTTGTLTESSKRSVRT